MTKGSIFLMQPGDAETLVELRESEYDAEALLQTLIAKYPQLLAGDQMNSSAPRQFLLVTQEMMVPQDEAAASRCFLDHLFLDQDAVPTLIEIKLSRDTRIRREVVGQMLDYAANAVTYWPIERIIDSFEKTWTARGQDPDAALDDFLGGVGSKEEFWKKVETNLEAGYIRMVFVADAIPPQLQRIVEFLNGQMNRAEVLALEVKQFTGENLQTLVPRLIGATAEADARKKVATSSGLQWNEKSFVDALRAAGHPELEAVYKAIHGWTIAKNLQAFWGSGKNYGNFIPVLPLGGLKSSCVQLRSTCEVLITFTYIRNTPGFQDESQRRELARWFNQIPGANISLDALTGYSSFQMASLVPPESMNQFLATLDWFFTTVREAIARNKA